MAFSGLNGPNLGDNIEIWIGSDIKWGFYTGEGNIIHVSDEPVGVSASPKVLIKEEPLSRVAAGGTWRVNNMLDEMYKPRDVKAMVEDAKDLVGEAVPSQLTGNGLGPFLFLRYEFLEQRKETKEETKKEEKEKELSSKVGALLGKAAGVGATVAKAAIKPLQVVAIQGLEEAQQGLSTEEESATARALLLHGKEDPNKSTENYMELLRMAVLFAGLYIVKILRNKREGRPRKNYQRGDEERDQQEGGVDVSENSFQKERDEPLVSNLVKEYYPHMWTAQKEEEMEYESRLVLEDLQSGAVQAHWLN